jgi:hypothetical protein
MSYVNFTGDVRVRVVFKWLNLIYYLNYLLFIFGLIIKWVEELLKR